jgi:hypothetical protein
VTEFLGFRQCTRESIPPPPPPYMSCNTPHPTPPILSHSKGCGRSYMAALADSPRLKCYRFPAAEPSVFPSRSDLTLVKSATEHSTTHPLGAANKSPQHSLTHSAHAAAGATAAGLLTGMLLHTQGVHSAAAHLTNCKVHPAAAHLFIHTNAIGHCMSISSRRPTTQGQPKN